MRQVSYTPPIVHIRTSQTRYEFWLRYLANSWEGTTISAPNEVKEMIYKYL